jgi:hypothetical protein
MITTPRLVINEGAQFDGDCKIPASQSLIGRTTKLL